MTQVSKEISTLSDNREAHYHRQAKILQQQRIKRLTSNYVMCVNYQKSPCT